MYIAYFLFHYFTYLLYYFIYYFSILLYYNMLHFVQRKESILYVSLFRKIQPYLYRHLNPTLARVPFL